jgi:hypothetical protein
MESAEQGRNQAAVTSEGNAPCAVDLLRKRILLKFSPAKARMQLRFVQLNDVGCNLNQPPIRKLKDITAGHVRVCHGESPACRTLLQFDRYLNPCKVSLSYSGWDGACTLIIGDNDAMRGDFAFGYLERGGERATGKQPLATAQG